MKYSVLIVGECSMSLLNYLDTKNHTYYILQSSVAKRVREHLRDKTTVVDFADVDELKEAASILHKKHTFTNTICEYEGYVYHTAIVNEALSLEGNSVDTAIACTDKHIMRELFSQASFKISPDYRLVSSGDEVKLFAREHSFPLVIKAAGLAKSMLVVICDDQQSLDREYEIMAREIESVYQEHAPLKKPKIIIEEFLRGSVHSVEGYADSEGNILIIPHIVDCTTGREIGVDDNFHYKLSLPTRLTEKEQAKAFKACEEAMRSLGMRSSAAHIEFIMTSEGPMLIEIGARNGGYRPRMYYYANGLDIYGAWLEANCGRLPILSTEQDIACTEIDFVPAKRGVFKEISNVDTLRSLTSLKDFSQMSNADDKTGRAADGFRPCGYAILANKDRYQLSKDIAFIDKEVKVVLRD